MAIPSKRLWVEKAKMTREVRKWTSLIGTLFFLFLKWISLMGTFRFTL